MKKSKWWTLVLPMPVFLVVILAIATCVQKTETENVLPDQVVTPVITPAPAPDYRIEKLADNLFRVMGLKEESLRDWRGVDLGYEESFAKALKELGENYTIVKTEEVKHALADTFVIKELYVYVEPKGLR